MSSDYDKPGAACSVRVDMECRVLNLDGKPSAEIYQVIDKADRKGRVNLAVKGTIRRDDSGGIVHAKKLSGVSAKRLLPAHADRLAVAVEVPRGGGYLAQCPLCGRSEPVTPSDPSVKCPDHGEFQLFWIGGKPVVAANKPKAKPAKPAKPAKTAHADRPPKEPAHAKPAHAKLAGPTKVDVSPLHRLGQLWLKENVPFDHPNDVKAYVLLVRHRSGDDKFYRKFCFNTYDGTLGKKAKELPMDVYSDPDSGFAVANLEKEKAKLTKQGYSRVDKQAKAEAPEADAAQAAEAEGGAA